MNYSDFPGDVRADVFDKNGKWEYTFAMRMDTDDYNNPNCHAAVVDAIRRREIMLLAGQIVVVLEPYNKFAVPSILRVR